LCEQGHLYPSVEGIPVLLLSDVPQTHGEAIKALEVAWMENAAERVGIGSTSDTINPHVQQLVASTCGLLYRPLIGKLRRYPIPELRLPEGQERSFLDIGCSWGRWTIAAARKKYRAIGMDPSLGAVLVARQVSRQLGLDCEFIVADARYLPFRSEAIDAVFSYSVIQHFRKEDAYQALAGIGRVLTASGRCLVQMPNKYGLRSLYHVARRANRAPTGFEVRYWTPSELKRVFQDKIGKAEITVDGFFGLGIQASDLDLLPQAYRMIARASEWLRVLSHYVPFMSNLADSLFVEVRRK
jgi:SAM-dependent methyltransferase